MTERVVDGRLSGISIERMSAAVEWRLYRFRKSVVEMKRRRALRTLGEVLVDPRPGIRSDSEELFQRLQAMFPPHPEYGYDDLSVWKRAANRASYLLSLPGMHIPGKRTLEIGAGDGMTSRLLADYGHDVSLVDIEDWRHKRARDLRFVVRDACDPLPVEMGPFDLVFSYCAFEHIRNPELAFRNMLKVCRPGALLLIFANPLYYSPWGLHAYRLFRMPYPQFIFSSDFISEKLRHSGIFDIGRESDELQPLNRWRVRNFQALWHVDQLEILDEHVGMDDSHLDFVLQHRQAFTGLSIGAEDLFAEEIRALVRLRE